MKIKILSVIAALALSACGDTNTEYIEREYPCDLYQWGYETGEWEWVQINDLSEGENVQPLDFCGYDGEDFTRFRTGDESDYHIRCQAPGGIVTACFLDY